GGGTRTRPPPPSARLPERVARAGGARTQRRPYSARMAIADVHAIPETADACNEYQTEADQAWTDGNEDHAWDLYRSLFESKVKTDAQESHVAHRLALIAVNRRDADNAWNYIAYSK